MNEEAEEKLCEEGAFAKTSCLFLDPHSLSFTETTQSYTELVWGQK